MEDGFQTSYAVGGYSQSSLGLKEWESTFIFKIQKARSSICRYRFKKAPIQRLRAAAKYFRSSMGAALSDRMGGLFSDTATSLNGW